MCGWPPEEEEEAAEIISSISDAKFIGMDGRYILARDYLHCKIWDVNMERDPLITIPVHEYLQPHLADLYENDCIFDRFECDASSDGSKILTGSYNNNFIIHDIHTNETIRIEALKDGPRRQHMSGSGAFNQFKQRPPHKSKHTAINQTDIPNVNLMDFGKKALHVSWHPQNNTLAIAGLNKLYIYQAMAAPNTTL